MDWYCYFIVEDGQRTYIGITNNLIKRIGIHNSKDSAKSTRSGKNWRYHTVIGGFNKSQAASFEWYWKHKFTKKWVRNPAGLNNKMNRLIELLTDKKWQGYRFINPPCPF